MDRNKHNDWTDLVRERLEGRELTPSEQLWEKVGAALPGAGAAPRVRRLPAWAGAFAAVAAAVAAVLVLRPSGAPEPGRVELVPAAAPVLAEEAQAVTAEVEEPMPEMVAQLASAGSRRLVAQAVAPEEDSPAPPDDTAGAGSNDTAEEAAGAGLDSTPEEADVPAGVSAIQGTVREPLPQQRDADNPQSISMEEFLAQEGDGRPTKRRASAGVYAAGMVSTDFMVTRDYVEDISELPQYSHADPTGPGLSTSLDPESPYNPQPGISQGINNINAPAHYLEPGMVHSKPISLGLSLTFPLGEHLFLESGAYYSWLHSKTAGGSGQSLHSAGIPLKLGWRFGSAGRTSFALSAGAKAEKCFYAVRNGQRFKEPGIQTAGVASAAVLYDITPSLGIYLAPELSYWFTRTQLTTYNSVNPLNLTFKAGLNITLER